MRNIKNIIFDYGGVIINIDYQLTTDAFKNLGIVDFVKKMNKVNGYNFLDKFDIGEISSDTFRSEVRKILPVPISDKEIDNAWGKMLLDIPSENLEVLSNLKNKYRLFLLSNTNEIHINAIELYLQKIHGFSSINIFFEKVYYSHLIGMRKPDLNIFQLIINENKLIPLETLYLDDTMEHVEAAKKAGFYAMHFKRNQPLSIFFKNLNFHQPK